MLVSWRIFAGSMRFQILHVSPRTSLNIIIIIVLFVNIIISIGVMLLYLICPQKQADVICY